MLSIKELSKVKPESYPRNDIGSSNLFHALYCDILRYVPERKAFMRYNGKVWERDMDDLQAHEYAKDFAVSMLNYCNTLASENKDELKELDINPIFVYPEGEGVGVADALIVKYEK